jgi:hypothetical protein
MGKYGFQIQSARSIKLKGADLIHCFIGVRREGDKDKNGISE